MTQLHSGAIYDGRWFASYRRAFVPHLFWFPAEAPNPCGGDVTGSKVLTQIKKLKNRSTPKA